MKRKKNKKTILWFLKAAAAGVTALLLMSLLCVLYYNVPVHYTNPSGATEYYWEQGRFYSRATEGFAWGRTNNEGFNNLYDHHEGDKTDILLMGTSHTNGFNVAQDENVGAVLTRLFGGERVVYNIGTAGHTLMYNLKNLDDALTYYNPTQYAIIECNFVTAKNAELRAILDNSYPGIPSHTGGLVTLLQKIPYLRLLYTKYIEGMNFGGEAGSSSPDDDMAENRALYGQVMAKAADTAEKHGVKLIIVLDSMVYMDEQLNCYVDVDAASVAAMEEMCADNGIEFINACETLTAAAKENMRLPYGFANTEPGRGHLNSWGHELLADCIYGRIAQMEG